VAEYWQAHSRESQHSTGTKGCACSRALPETCGTGPGQYWGGDRPGSPSGAVSFLPEGIVHKQARGWQAALGFASPGSRALPETCGTGPGQHWGGGPPGKPSGCCRFFARRHRAQTGPTLAGSPWGLRAQDQELCLKVVGTRGAGGRADCRQEEPSAASKSGGGAGASALLSLHSVC
jgi:hypothetical protein